MKPKIAIPLGVAGILAAIGTAIANANGLLSGHPFLAYWLYGASLLLIVISVGGAVADWLRSRTNSPVSPSSVATPASPVNISISDVGNIGQRFPVAHPISATPSAPMPKAKPRIEVLGPEAIPVGWTHNAVTHVNTFHEDPEGNQTGVILYFRNLAIYGEEIGSVRGAKARLHVYRDAQEIGKGFGASWLGTSGFAVDLISGGDTKGIPLLLKNERDEYSTPWTKISTAVYPPSIYSRFELYDEPPTGFTVILLDSNDQTIIPVITIQLEDADKLLYRRS